jgi:anti-anti-sigma regulatory factor
VLVREEAEIVSLLAINTLGEDALSLVGEVDAFTRSTFAAAIDELVARGGDLHLHLADLSFIDVGGATVLATRALSLPPGRKLVLHDPPPELRRLIDLMWAGHPGLEMEPR